MFPCYSLNSQSEFAAYHRELKSVLCHNLVGWDAVGPGWGIQEGGDIWVIHADEWQKPTQYYKAIILQLRINTFFKMSIPL